MRKVIYPKGTAYEQTYLNLFQGELANMQQNWADLKNEYTAEFGHIPSNVNDILKADYSTLVTWYVQFKQLPFSSRNVLNGRLKSIFDYDKWSAVIADYFKNPQNGFNISSCHYCDMSYINAFEVDPEADGLYILNNTPHDELKVKLGTRVDSKVEEVMRHKYNSKADFERIAVTLRWKPGKFDRMFNPQDKYRHHFDLDHALPKSEFWLVALSLYNFVPSCQICNQKLKRSRVLGSGGIPKENLSPSSPLFDGERKTEFHLLPKADVKAGRLKPSQNPQDYDIRLDAIDPDYDDFIKLFKLEERYQQHKRVALHWLEMKYKYSDAHIKMMEEALKEHRNLDFSFSRIKSDIFQNELYRDKSMSFSKLREDMLK